MIERKQSRVQSRAETRANRPTGACSSLQLGSEREGTDQGRSSKGERNVYQRTFSLFCF